VSATWHASYLSWADTRRAAAVLRAAREAAGAGQRDVADQMGWSQGKVSCLERAVTRMTPEDALAIAGVLGADLSGLGVASLEKPEADGATNEQAG
jgi:transcriptional regulator with XRE-family HTH domain